MQEPGSYGKINPKNDSLNHLLKAIETCNIILNILTLYLEEN